MLAGLSGLKLCNPSSAMTRHVVIHILGEEVNDAALGSVYKRLMGSSMQSQNVLAVACHLSS